MFTLLLSQTNCWKSSRVIGDLRRHNCNVRRNDRLSDCARKYVLKTTGCDSLVLSLWRDDLPERVKFLATYLFVSLDILALARPQNFSRSLDVWNVFDALSMLDVHQTTAHLFSSSDINTWTLILVVVNPEYSGILPEYIGQSLGSLRSPAIMTLAMQDRQTLVYSEGEYHRSATF